MISEEKFGPRREERQIVRVNPRTRFHPEKWQGGWDHRGSVVFWGKSKFYFCPRCSRKTLVNWVKLNIAPSNDPWPYAGPDSIFPPELQWIFDSHANDRLAFDFYCRGCGSPVRLIFWIEERRMGGAWFPEVFEVLELEP